MDLSHPERLLVLLLVPLLWWLARPPRPRLRVVTAHLAQWQRALARLRRRPVRFRKLRFWLLVTALLAIGAATAGPRVGVHDGPRALAVVLDATASTAAREPDGGTAFERSRARLSATLDALPAGVTARLLVVGSELRVIDTGVQDFDAQLEQLRPGGSAGVAIDELVARLDGADVAVWTLTDGRDGVPARGALSLFGAAELDNAGITSCAVADSWPLPDVSVSLTVVGTADWEFAVEGGAEAAGPAIADSDAPGSLRVPLRRVDGGPVRLRLQHRGPDTLDQDDVAVFVIAPPPAPEIAVLLAEGGGRWAARAAAALAELGGGRVLDSAVGRDAAGFIVADGGQLEAPPARAVTFGTALATPGTWGPGGAPSDWDRVHPVTRRLDLSELRVAAVLDPAALPVDGVPLILGPNRTWLVAVEREQQRSIHAAFRLDDSNLPLLPAFPQLLRRAFAWCYGAGAVAAFDPSSLPGAAETELRRSEPAPTERPLPPFGDDGLSLTIPLLALAFALLAGRLYA